MATSNGTKALSESSLNGIQAIPKPGQMRIVGNSLVVRLGGKTDDAPNWWHVHAFDKYTESLWTPPGEPFLAGAIATVASQYSARTYFIDGPKRIVNATTTMLESADQGRGMVSLFLKTVQDLKARNNGAFWGLMRDVDFTQFASVEAIEKYKPAERALVLAQRGKLPPVTTIEHLDSGQCYRTGNPLYPILYRDAVSGRTLWLPWFMVVAMAELPFPVSRYGGIQLSAVGRVMRATQIMIAKQTYKLEKITGRNPEDIHFISGVNREETKDQLAYGNEEADNEGLVRWQDAAMVFGINPERPISIATLSAKSDSAFDDIDKEMQWYITAVTDNFLETYQMLAPLQAGGLGNSQQSIILADAAQGKGPALWEKMIAQIMHQYAIVPRNCSWKWGEKSIRYEKDVADLTAVQLANMVVLKRDLEVPKELVYQIMADKGIELNDEYLAMLGERDQTDDITVADDEQQPELGEATDVELAPTLDDIIAGRVTATEAGGNVQAQALNGAQVSSLLEIVGMYTAGTLSLTSAQAIIAASFPFLSPVSITAILSKGGLEETGIVIVDPNATLKALSILHCSYKASEAEGLIAEFEDTVYQAVNGYVEGTLNKRSAQSAFIKAIQSAWPMVAEVGYEAGGGDWADVSEEDDHTVEDDMTAQVAYATNYFDDLPDIKESSETLPDARTGLYVQSLRGLYNKYKTLGAGNKKLTFALGNTTEHCKTCLDLNGQTHGAKWWIKHNLVPRIAGNENFECGCWNCDCRLVDASGEDFTL